MPFNLVIIPHFLTEAAFYLTGIVLSYLQFLLKEKKINLNQKDLPWNSLLTISTTVIYFLDFTWKCPSNEVWFVFWDFCTLVVTLVVWTKSFKWSFSQIILKYKFFFRFLINIWNKHNMHLLFPIDYLTKKTNIRKGSYFGYKTKNFRFFFVGSRWKVWFRVWRPDWRSCKLRQRRSSPKQLPLFAESSGSRF